MSEKQLDDDTSPDKENNDDSKDELNNESEPKSDEVNDKASLDTENNDESKHESTNDSKTISEDPVEKVEEHKTENILEEKEENSEMDTDVSADNLNMANEKKEENKDIEMEISVISEIEQKEKEDTKDGDSQTPLTDKTIEDEKKVESGTQQNEKETNTKSTAGIITPSTFKSKLDNYLKRQSDMLTRIEKLETYIQKSTTLKRRRAAFLLDARPSYRSTHLRLYTFHYCSKSQISSSPSARPPYTPAQSQIPIQSYAKGTKWTLVIEGRLLVPQESSSGRLLKKTKEEEGYETYKKDNNKNQSGINALNSNQSAPYQHNLGTAPNLSTYNHSNVSNYPPTVSTIPATIARPPIPGSSFQPSLETTSAGNTTGSTTNEANEHKPLLFTHLFDKIVVSFQKVIETAQQSKANDAKDGSGNNSNVPSIKIKKRRLSANEKKTEKLSSAAKTPTVVNQLEHPPKVLTWTRQRATVEDTTFYPTEDAHAFHAIYFDPDKESNDNVEPQNQPQQNTSNSTKIIAKVSLYRRWIPSTSNVDSRYKPSPDLIRLLLPNFIPKDPYLEALDEKIQKSASQNNSTNNGSNTEESGGGKKTPRKKAKITISMNSSKKKKQSKAPSPTPSSQPSTASTSTNPSISVASSSTSLDPLESFKDDTIIPNHSSFHIPQTLTMKEAVSAIFIYIKERNLQDRSDLSIVNNDEKLSTLFGCNRMLFSKIQELLISRNLLTEVTNQNMEPVILTYVMTDPTSTPLPDWKDEKVQPRTSSFIQPGINPSLNSITSQRLVPTQDPSTTAPTTTNTPSAEPSKTSQKPGALTSKRRRGETKAVEVVPPPCHPESLIFNMNIDVPSDFHPRIIELLRRVKRRELEYTSSRTKALKILLNSITDGSNSNNNTDKEEAFIKSKIDEVVSGRGTMGKMQHYLPVLMALAKSAPVGSEARNAAHLDARMNLLLDRLEYHTRAAKICWNVVDACRNF